ncbi:hypothetical protein B0H63DRAFT_95898 [Podospora didyma]|uniref:Uncharacterized protein n=1 Tax=Podospora didyma TaxID=330526 RepID=A0AAE0U387_9PEZI|nr:hypothetical protein B0H63DRAFT_95898 [Podospora didyma]
MMAPALVFLAWGVVLSGVPFCTAAPAVTEKDAQDQSDPALPIFAPPIIPLLPPDFPRLVPQPVLPICALRPIKPCFTYTATTTLLACPRIPCPKPKEPPICPLIVRITAVAVPCSDLCCPVTPTAFVTTPCPGCPTGCVIRPTPRPSRPAAWKPQP